ncbi:reverse transcriptase domain-containing protein [Tanacetum coccineum]
MGVKNLQANVDSRLVANQVNGTYDAKETDMVRYLEKGSYSMHAGTRSVVAKALQIGYYWPTMHEDARKLIRACQDCQIHRPVPRSPQQKLSPITSPWPFYKWGIDIAGPFPEGPRKEKSSRIMENNSKTIRSRTGAKSYVSANTLLLLNIYKPMEFVINLCDVASVALITGNVLLVSVIKQGGCEDLPCLQTTLRPLLLICLYLLIQREHHLGMPLVECRRFPEMTRTRRLTNKGRHTHCHLPMYLILWSWMSMYQYMFRSQSTRSTMHHQSIGIQVEDSNLYADDASLTTEPPGYIADSDSIEEDTNADSIDYPDEPEDREKDDDEDPEEDPSEEHEPEDDDDDDDTDNEDEELTEDEEEEEHLAPADSPVVLVVDLVPSDRDTEAFETDEAWKTVRIEPPMSESMEARIVEHVATLIPPTNPTYNQAPLGHRAAMIHMKDDIPEEDMPPRRRFVLTAPSPRCDVSESSAAAARAPRGQYDFVDAVEAEQGLICSPGHDTRAIARAADRA